MTPPVSLAEAVLLATAIACGVTDTLTGKVLNKVTYPAIVTGLSLHWFQIGTGGQAFADSLSGFVVGFLGMLVFFLAGVVGAGDVKFMAAVGALGGYPFVFQVLVFSFLCGGLIGLAKAIAQGKIGLALRQVGDLISKGELSAGDDGSRGSGVEVPFGVAIAYGTIAAMIGQALGSPVLFLW